MIQHNSLQESTMKEIPEYKETPEHKSLRRRHRGWKLRLKPAMMVYTPKA
jgi:hypothetical protein